MLKRRGFLSTLSASSLGAAVLGRLPLLDSPSVGRPAVAAPEPPRAYEPLPWPDDSDPAFWDRIRDQFYITPGEAYFNTGTLGATPRPVLERVIEEMRVLQETITRWDYTEQTPNWISGYSPETPLREKVGKLVNASADEIALTQNATFGMNFVAHGIDLKAGDEIITTDQEHPGGVCGWQERAKRDGAVWKQVKIPIPANDPDQLVDLFRQAITPRTRVLAFPRWPTSTAASPLWMAPRRWGRSRSISTTWVATPTSPVPTSGCWRPPATAFFTSLARSRTSSGLRCAVPSGTIISKACIASCSTAPATRRSKPASMPRSTSTSVSDRNASASGCARWPIACAPACNRSPAPRSAPRSIPNCAGPWSSGGSRACRP